MSLVIVDNDGRTTTTSFSNYYIKKYIMTVYCVFSIRQWELDLGFHEIAVQLTKLGFTPCVLGIAAFQIC